MDFALDAGDLHGTGSGYVVHSRQAITGIAVRSGTPRWARPSAIWFSGRCSPRRRGASCTTVPAPIRGPDRVKPVLSDRRIRGLPTAPGSSTPGEEPPLCLMPAKRFEAPDGRIMVRTAGATARPSRFAASSPRRRRHSDGSVDGLSAWSVGGSAIVRMASSSSSATGWTRIAPGAGSAANGTVSVTWMIGVSVSSSRQRSPVNRPCVTAT